jgi:hypothetical protein
MNLNHTDELINLSFIIKTSGEIVPAMPDDEEFSPQQIRDYVAGPPELFCDARQKFRLGPERTVVFDQQERVVENLSQRLGVSRLVGLVPQPLKREHLQLGPCGNSDRRACKSGEYAATAG